MVAEGYKNELDSGYSFKGEPTRFSGGWMWPVRNDSRMTLRL